MKNLIYTGILAFVMLLGASACGSGQRTEDDDPDTVLTDTNASDTLDTLGIKSTDPSAQGLKDDSVQTDSMP